MKKVLLAVIISALTLTLVGCDIDDRSDNVYCEEEYDATWDVRLNQCIMNGYTQAEVDALIATALAEGASDDLYVLGLVDDDYYNKDYIDLLYFTKTETQEQIKITKDNILQSVTFERDLDLAPLFKRIQDLESEVRILKSK